MVPGAIDLAADTVVGCISSRRDEATAVDYVHSNYDTACLRTPRIWRWTSLETIIADTIIPLDPGSLKVQSVPYEHGL